MRLRAKKPCFINFVMYGDDERKDTFEVEDDVGATTRLEIAERISFGYIVPVDHLPDDIMQAKKAYDAHQDGGPAPTVAIFSAPGEKPKKGKE